MHRAEKARRLFQHYSGAVSPGRSNIDHGNKQQHIPVKITGTDT